MRCAQEFAHGKTRAGTTATTSGGSSSGQGLQALPEKFAGGPAGSGSISSNNNKKGGAPSTNKPAVSQDEYLHTGSPEAAPQALTEDREGKGWAFDPPVLLLTGGGMQHWLSLSFFAGGGSRDGLRSYALLTGLSVVPASQTAVALHPNPGPSYPDASPIAHA